MSKAGDEFRCSVCRETFRKMVDDELALEETRETFGFIPPEHERSVICDQCWQEFLPWADAHGLTVER